jgi:hypothetical protein
MTIIQDTVDALYLDLPGIDEHHEGYFVAVTKHSALWSYVVTDNGCDFEISRGSCNPDMKSLFSVLMNGD